MRTLIASLVLLALAGCTGQPTGPHGVLGAELIPDTAPLATSITVVESIWLSPSNQLREVSRRTVPVTKEQAKQLARTKGGAVDVGERRRVLKLLNDLGITEDGVYSGGQAADDDLTALAAISGVRGDLIYYGASGWTRLAKGTSTHVLTQGANDPAWSAPAASGWSDSGADVTLATITDGVGMGGFPAAATRLLVAGDVTRKNVQISAGTNGAITLANGGGTVTGTFDNLGLTLAGGAHYLTEGAGESGNPATGIVKVYAKTDGLLYSKDDAGLERLVSSGGRAHVTRAAAQTITTATITNVSFDTEDWDTDTMWVVGTPTRLTVATAGYYRVSGRVQWATDGTGYRWVFVEHYNSSNVRYRYVDDNRAAVTGAETAQCVTDDFNAVAGDYFVLAVLHNAGGNRDVQAANFSATRN